MKRPDISSSSKDLLTKILIIWFLSLQEFKRHTTLVTAAGSEAHRVTRVNYNYPGQGYLMTSRACTAPSEAYSFIPSFIQPLNQYSSEASSGLLGLLQVPDKTTLPDLKGGLQSDQSSREVHAPQPSANLLRDQRPLGGVRISFLWLLVYTVLQTKWLCFLER